jgi:hypothetical protein
MLDRKSATNMTKQSKTNTFTYSDKAEQDRRKEFVQLVKECPIPQNELLLNLGLFLTPQALSRILFIDFLYKQIIELQGSIIEFGCRWGQNLSLFSALRGIYEPFNRLRKVIGFDTFAGFPKVSIEDGMNSSAGMYSVTSEYDTYLSKILELQEQESPLSYVKKFDIIKGDASVCCKEYFANHPETIVALAYFDFDLYEPTRDCLLQIKDRLTKGSVIGFDELNEEKFPGETVAVREVLGLDRYTIRRFPFNARTSYIIVE